MGAWVIASVFYACFLLTEGQNPLAKFKIQPIPVRLPRHTHGLEVTKGLLVGGGIHSAVPIKNSPEVYYDPYDVRVYKFSAEDARYPGQYFYGYGEGNSYENDVNYKEFASIEAEADGYNQQLDTAGYDHYKTANSFTLEGPRQLETITSHSYHKESEPFDVSDYQNSHKEDEEDAEVHYHQHKHLHKHTHKQEHVHKHEQDHEHEHGHDHDHHAQHEHKHDSQHKHDHSSEHKHLHEADHHHSHLQEHEHSHHESHKEEHKHLQDHKHDHLHGHMHSHLGEQTHLHDADHKHDHHHGHEHEDQNEHKHEHHGKHKHLHGHSDEHKHKYLDSHNHKHSHHQY